MKKKVSLVLLIACLVILVVAADYGDVYARADARVSQDNTYAYAYARVKDGPKVENEQTGGQNTTSQATATSNNYRGSWATAQAYASNVWNEYFRTSRYSHIMPFDWGQTKSAVIDSVVAEVEFACSLFTITGEPAKIGVFTSGSGKLFPIQAGENNKSIFQAAVTDAGDTTVFEGQITMSSNGTITVGDYGDNTGIVVTTLGDTIFTTVSRQDTVDFAGQRSDLELTGKVTGEIVYTPTLTEWGLIIFAGLFILTLIYVIRRRRAKAAIAA